MVVALATMVAEGDDDAPAGVPEWEGARLVQLPADAPTEAEEAMRRAVADTLLSAAPIPATVMENTGASAETVRYALDGVVQVLVSTYFEAAGYLRECPSPADPSAVDGLSCLVWSHLRGVLARVRVSSPSFVDVVASFADENGDGQVDATELATAVHALHLDARSDDGGAQPMRRALYRLMDVDKNGAVTPGEMRQVLEAVGDTIAGIMWQVTDAAAETLHALAPQVTATALSGAAAAAAGGGEGRVTLADFVAHAPVMSDLSVSSSVSMWFWRLLFGHPEVASFLMLMQHEAQAMVGTFVRAAGTAHAVNTEIARVVFTREMEAWAYGGSDGGVVTGVTATLALDQMLALARGILAATDVHGLLGMKEPVPQPGSASSAESGSGIAASLSISSILEGPDGSVTSSTMNYPHSLESTSVNVAAQSARWAMPSIVDATFALFDRDGSDALSRREVLPYANLTRPFTSQAIGRILMHAPPATGTSAPLYVTSVVRAFAFAVFDVLDSNGDGVVLLGQGVAGDAGGAAVVAAIADTAAMAMRAIVEIMHAVSVAIVSEVVEAVFSKPNALRGTADGDWWLDSNGDGQITWAEAQTFFEAHTLAGGSGSGALA